MKNCFFLFFKKNNKIFEWIFLLKESEKLTFIIIRRFYMKFGLVEKENSVKLFMRLEVDLIIIKIY